MIHEYKGYRIVKVTRKDWCVYINGKIAFDGLTLRSAKEYIDSMVD